MIFALNLLSTTFGALEKGILLFSVREWTEFNKSCNLIGSWSGRNFLELDASISYSTMKLMRSTCGLKNEK